MKTVSSICDQCGKRFESSPSAKRRFCSHECYGASKRRRVACICQDCGKEFETFPVEIRKGGGKYCSRDCFFKSNSGAGNVSWRGGVRRLTCIQCGKEFDRPLNHPKPGKRVFCSQDCRTVFVRANPDKTPNWKDGATPKHEQERKSWRYLQWRDEVYSRDNYTCRICGQRGGRLQAHHLYRFALYRHLRYVVDNGHTLCVSCHRAIKNKERDYLVSLGFDPDAPPFGKEKDA